MNRRTLVIGLAAVAAVAFGGAAVLYPRLQPSPAAQADDTLVRAHAPVVGPADAKVTIVEFLDPSCEACRAFYPIVKQIMAAYPDQTRLVVRYAPLHEGSDEAVRIIEAARLQDKFLPVMEALFRDQDQWAAHGAPDLARAWTIAEAAGLDLARARADAQSAAVSQVLTQDMADMKAINLQGTPTFYVNGKPLTTFSPQGLQDLVAAEIAAADGPAS